MTVTTTLEPKGKLDTAAAAVVNGPEDGPAGWHAVDWRAAMAPLAGFQLLPDQGADDLAAHQRLVGVTFDAGAAVDDFVLLELGYHCRAPCVMTRVPRPAGPARRTDRAARRKAGRGNCLVARTG